MPEQKSSGFNLFEKTTSFLIVAVAVGMAIVVPGVLWIADNFGWDLPAPVKKLSEMLGIG